MSGITRMRMYPSLAFGNQASVLGAIISLRADDIAFAENLDRRVTAIEAFGGGGAGDHGLLTGLADDDHPQYLNNARLALKNENDLEGIPLSTTINYSMGNVSEVIKGAITKTFSYNMDGTINTIDDGTYLKTFGYSAGDLVSITVTP